MRVDKVWEINTGKSPLYRGVLRDKVAILGNATGDIFAINLETLTLENVKKVEGGITALYADHTLIACGTSAGLLYIWKNASEKTFNLGNPIFSITHNGTSLLCGDSKGNVILLENFEEECTPLFMKIGVGKIRCMEKNSNRIIYSSQDGFMRIYDINEGKVERAWWTHALSVNCFLINLENGWCLTAGKEGKIREWDLSFSIPAMKKEVQAHLNAIYSLVKMGNYLISTSLDKSFRIWSLDLQLLKHIDREKGGHAFSVNGAIPMDETSFLTYSDDRKVICWTIC